MKEHYSSILIEFFEKMPSRENGIVADRDISLPQMHLLEVLGNNGTLRMKELSDRLSVTTGTLTVMVHRLVSKGYVAREKDSEDKRSWFVTLTGKGREEYDNHHHMHGQLIEEIAGALGEKDAPVFFRQLETILEAF